MLVDFIIPTYNRPAPLRAMLASLVAQTNGNWVANVVIDGKDYLNDTLDIIEEIDDPRITYTVTDKRYNDWGHTPREFGKQMSKCQYVIMTGDDNYYTPNFVKELELRTEMDYGMIYWDMVHSHYDYTYFQCIPAVNKIDMGAFATRRDLAQQIKLGTEYAADGLYVEKFRQQFPSERIVKIEKVLFVHN